MNLSSRIRIRGPISFLTKIANSGVKHQTPCLSVYSERPPDVISANNVHHLYKDSKIWSRSRLPLPLVPLHRRSTPLAFTHSSISLTDVLSNLNTSFPLPVPNKFILPTCYEQLEKIDRFDPTPLEMPPEEGNYKKQAARLIVIRKRKMKKHKLQKLRKKMKFEWAKVRQRREMRKEKAFQAELIAQIKEAEKFDAAQFVAEQLRKAHEIKIPRTWKGKRLPEFIIKEKLGIK